MTQDIIIHIVSDRHLVSEALTDATEESRGGFTPFDTEVLPPDAENEHTDIIYRGTMTDEDGQISVNYEDCEMSDGTYSTPTVLTFNRGEPDLVTMVREGAFSTSLTFKPKKRHVCIYSVMFTEIQLTVHTLDVQNRILEDGLLTLDYIIEILGAQTERTRLEMTIKKAPDAEA